jgi:hypothetical protein
MKRLKILMALLSVTVFLSCKKYLDASPNASLAIPSTLKDLQALMDNYDGMNAQFPAGEEILADNYYLTNDDWAAIYQEDQRNYYIWQPDDNINQDWQTPYNNIYTCNIVLENLNPVSISPTEEISAAAIKGTALFFRATNFFNLAQLFAKGFDSATAAADPGIPLRLTTDLKERSTRASVLATYNQIIVDFKMAITLLPDVSAVKSRPVKAAAYGALARTYLAMQEYTHAGLYADSCLQKYNTLIDYNFLDSNADNPIERFNDEVIFQALSHTVSPLSPDICKIDSELYKSYAANDLRKVICFRDNGDGTYGFKGDYDGGTDNGGHAFTGIVTDEQYLIKAECDVRQNKITEALTALNTLLKKRYNAADFVPVTISDPLSLLTIILSERRKELLFRGTRWTDLKRLNKDPHFEITLKREINGDVYMLPPNDKRYVALLPKDVIQISGMEQNP